MITFLGKTISCEIELQALIAQRLSQAPYVFTLLKETWCDIGDVFHNIYIEVKLTSWKDGAAQLLYGAFRKFGKKGLRNFTPLIFGLADEKEIHFFIVPSFADLRDFYNSIDPTGKLAPSAVPKNKNADALLLLGADIYTRLHSDKGPLNINVPYIYITTKNIVELINTKFAKYDIKARELISGISDVQSVNDLVIVEDHGRLITNNVTPSQVRCKRIKPEDIPFIEKLRVTPNDMKKLAEHYDEYEAIEIRRNLGKFFTSADLSSRVHNTILTHFEPDFILEPYAGTGSLCLPFIDTPGLMNDIIKVDIDIAKLSFGGSPWEFDNIDVIGSTAEELIDRWQLKKRWTENSVIYSNPPFGLIRSQQSLLKGSGSVKNKINFHESLKKYHSGDIVHTTIGQKIEILKHLKKGYLAFFSPVDIFCGRKNSNKILKELLSSFTFIGGLVLNGNEFNSVNKEKPISFTIWKFGGTTKHLNLEFDYYGKKIKLSSGNLLIDGWNYKENKDIIKDVLCVNARDTFNSQCPPMFSWGCNGTGSRVIPENVKKDIHFDTFPSEMIYALWSTTVAKTFGNTAVVAPTPFMGAYTHIPTDFTKPDNQKILTYSILWTLINELNHHYTSDNIGFPNGTFKFGTPKQTKAVKDLILKYGAEPCLDSTVLDTFNNLKLKAKGKWNRDKELRADLKKRLSGLLDKIGYWNKIIVAPVLTYQEEIQKNFGVKK